MYITSLSVGSSSPSLSALLLGALFVPFPRLRFSMGLCGKSAWSRKTQESGILEKARLSLRHTDRLRCKYSQKADRGCHQCVCWLFLLIIAPTKLTVNIVVSNCFNPYISFDIAYSIFFLLKLPENRFQQLENAFKIKFIKLFLSYIYFFLSLSSYQYWICIFPSETLR